MPFDPSQPWQPVDSGFDPSKPYTPVAAPKTVPALRGKGTADAPFDLSGGQSRGSIPRGAFYRDPRGNLRRNDNGDAGNPIITAPRKPSTVGDVVKSTLTGVVQGLDPYLGAQGELRRGLDSMDGVGAVQTWRKGLESLQAPARRSARQLAGSGLPVFSQIGDAALGAMDLAEVGNPIMPGAKSAPDARAVAAARQSVVGADYVPQTTPGQYGRAVGRMVPNAFVPGGMGRKAASVVLPAVTGEAARQTADVMGLGHGGQAVAEIGGQLLGGIGAGVNPGDVRRAAGSLRLPAPRKGMNYGDISSVEQDLRAAKQAAYQAAESAGAIYSPQATQQLSTQIAAAAARARINPMITPKAVGVLEELQAAGGKPLTLSEVDDLRKFVGLHLDDGSDAERRFAEIFRDQIDSFVDQASPEMMAAGDANQAASLITRAREANQRWRKVQDLSTRVAKKEDRAATTGVGGNADNAMRQAVLASYERQRGLSPSEEAAYRKAFSGSKTQNALRGLGRLSPETGGLQSIVNTAMAVGGYATGGVGGAAALTAPMAAGFFAKRIADGMTRNRVTALVQTLATGGPEARAAERELKALAGTDPEVAKVYSDIMAHLTRGGGLGAAFGASASLAPSTNTAGQ